MSQGDLQVGYPAERYFIYGPPGAGKSRLGRALAAQLDLPFFDLDQQIEVAAGRSIPDIFAREGEASFRLAEKNTLRALCLKPPAVISLGGGALIDDENRRQVESTGQVLFLDAPFSRLVDHLTGPNAAARPLLGSQPVNQLGELLLKRQSHYASFKLRLDSSQYSFEELVWQAQIALGVFRVTGMGEPYRVQICAGGLQDLPQKLASIDNFNPGSPVALVSDQNVQKWYLPTLEQALLAHDFLVGNAILPAGESSKTITGIMHLWDSFLTGGLERGSLVLALGGGVVSDLAGFATATYLRGVRWVALPTTLLAMCDASLGGKTGIDLPQGKNLVGAFHSPSLVVADPLVLNTLPDVELRNGLAEVAKHGVIGDPVLFDLLSKGWNSVHDHLPEIIRRAIAVKVRVICEDPFERGPRAVLNLGHTIGHALELLSNYRLRHGEAVAIGMAQAARLSVQEGLAQAELVDQISETLHILGLPTELPEATDRQALLQAMQRDKKRAQGKLRFVLPVKVGEVKTGVVINWVK